MSSALRRLLVTEVSAAVRGVKTSARTQYYDYEHGPHMVDFENMPNKQARVGGVLLLMLGTGVGIPCFAMLWQQAKLRG